MRIPSDRPHTHRASESPARALPRRRPLYHGDLCPRTPDGSPSRASARTFSSSSPCTAYRARARRRIVMPLPRKSAPLTAPPIRKRPRLDDLADEEPSASSASSRSRSASSDESSSPPPDYAVDADDEDGAYISPHSAAASAAAAAAAAATPSPRRPTRLAKPRSFLDAVNRHVEPMSRRARKLSQLTIAQIGAGEAYRSSCSSAENSSVQCISPPQTGARRVSRTASCAYGATHATSPASAARRASRSAESSASAPSQMRYVPHSPSATHSAPRRSRSHGSTSSASSSSASPRRRSVSRSPPPRAPAFRKRRLRRLTPPTPPSLALARPVSHSSHTHSPSDSSRSAPPNAHRPLPRHSRLPAAGARRASPPPRKMRRVHAGTQTDTHAYAGIDRPLPRNHPLTSQIDVIDLCDDLEDECRPSSQVVLHDDVEVVNLCSDSENERIKEAARVFASQRSRFTTKPPLRRR